MTIGRPLIRLDEITSTMDLARRLANQGATPGTGVIAGYQTHGRGRAGREWRATPWSSILLSFITASQGPMGSLGLLSLSWGLAVAQTVDAFTGGPSRVKWPNDVLIGDRKVAGILVTNGVVPGSIEYRQVTGIGLNCTNAPRELPPTATSLAIEMGAAPPTEEVLAELLSQLQSVFTSFEAGHRNALLDKIHHRLASLGEAVEVQDGTRTDVGVVRGIDSHGRLLIEDVAGAVRAIVAGDLTRGPRSGA